MGWGMGRICLGGVYQYDGLLGMMLASDGLERR
jgi:hypothetical protein